jgi:hypothetical protein
MPAEEFVSWQAFHRQHPFGFHWEDLNAARFLQAIESTKPREKGKKLPPVKDFLRTPPAPLFTERLRAEAAERKGTRDRRRTKVRRKG